MDSMMKEADMTPRRPVKGDLGSFHYISLVYLNNKTRRHSQTNMNGIVYLFINVCTSFIFAISCYY